jgi:hypothetical protein
MTVDYILSVIPYAMLGAALLFGLFLVLRWLVGLVNSDDRASATYSRAPTEEEMAALVYSQQQEDEESILRCPCGELATHPAPKLVRERNDKKQGVYASAPSYRRVVPKANPVLVVLGFQKIPKPELCESHAHSCDQTMDCFIYTEIRAEQARVNQRLAGRAAEFEAEKMKQAIRDGLTEEQKKKVRMLSQVAKPKLVRAANGGPVSEAPEA